MRSVKPNFRYIDHTADMGIIVEGTNIKNLFKEAAKAMMYIIVRGASLDKTKTIKLTLTGKDLPDLLVRWLGEILYLFEGEKEIVSEIDIDSISPSKLHATLKTVSYKPDLHKILCEIKAVTYHQINITQTGNSYRAKIIFDL